MIHGRLPCGSVNQQISRFSELGGQQALVFAQLAHLGDLLLNPKGRNRDGKVCQRLLSDEWRVSALSGLGDRCLNSGVIEAPSEITCGHATSAGTQSMESGRGNRGKLQADNAGRVTSATRLEEQILRFENITIVATVVVRDTQDRTAEPQVRLAGLMKLYDSDVSLRIAGYRAPKGIATDHLCNRR